MYAILLVLLLAGLVLHIATGPVDISMGTLWDVFLGQLPTTDPSYFIVMDIRMPKVTAAILAGGALAVSGLLMQTLFRNPLAGPSILGVTSGASLGVALVLLGTGQWLSADSLRVLGLGKSWLISLAGIGGATLVMLLVASVAVRVREAVTLLIIGMMVGNISGALVSLGEFFSHPEQVREFILWTFGSLDGTTKTQLGVMAVCVLIGSIGAFLCSKSLNVLLLGDMYAVSMGIRVNKNRIWLILAASVLAGSVTAFCGPIAFVGIAVPHVARGLFNTTDHRRLIPICLLLGATILVWCSVFSSWPTLFPSSLPINVVTTLLGSPFVIWVVLRQRKSMG